MVPYSQFATAEHMSHRHPSRSGKATAGQFAWVAERDSTASQAQGLCGRPGEHTLLAVLVLESRYGQQASQLRHRAWGRLSPITAV
jgi:hypothetical protein